MVSNFWQGSHLSIVGHALFSGILGSFDYLIIVIDRGQEAKCPLLARSGLKLRRGGGLNLSAKWLLV
jgi:hypothetical protein